ncbi:hypothetical protein Tco_0547827 [Tanacetum coccineum]
MSPLYTKESFLDNYKSSIILTDTRTDKGKGIATDDTEEPTRKLVPASREVCQDLDKPIRVPYEIYVKMYQLTNDEIQAHLDKEEKIQKAAEEAKLFAMSKLKLIKVVHEEALNQGIHPKNVKRQMELRKKRLEQYIWITSSIIKPEPITDVKIQLNSKPTLITICRGNDRRNFDVHNPFKFADFGVNELDELGSIIKRKKNMISALPPPAPEQGSSQLSGRKRQRMELEPEIHIPALECNMSLPELRVETLITYLLMASNITTFDNKRFCMKLRKLIADHPDQEKLQSKKVKLEFVGYKLD